MSFYTDVLGFRKQEDIPMGEYRWVTVVAPGEEADGPGCCSSPTPTRR